MLKEIFVNLINYLTYVFIIWACAKLIIDKFIKPKKPKK